MTRTITIIVLAIALVATGYWGYQEHQEKNAILVEAENNYQQAFHNLVYHVDQLQDKIGTTLAMSSKQTISPALAQVWRLSTAAHGEVGKLPLSLMPFNDTEEFLSNIGQFSYRLSTRNLNKRPMTGDEEQTLKKLYKRSTDIEHQLREVQAIIMKKDLRWMDVKAALASGEEPMDNSVIDGLKTVDKKVQGYDNINWGPEVTEMAKNREGQFAKLKGDKISPQEAKKVAREFFGFGQEVEIRVTGSGRNSNYAAYSVSMKNPKTGSTIQMDITKIGGHPIWMIQDRQTGKAKISLHKAQQIAAKFLKKHDKKNMKMAQSTQYDDTGSFTFVKVKDGVRIYPESIRLKVSLNKGNIVGYDGTDYIAFQRKREFKKPKLSRKEALKSLNENVDVKVMRKALITNDLGKEVLCYEILGTINDDTYRIFVNANNGVEEKVKKLQNPRPIYHSA
ncbi:MAG TPA: germination protein YpeB [Bacillales bacterium]